MSAVSETASGRVLPGEMADTKFPGQYTCRVCGEPHASDDQEIWCALAKRNAATEQRRADCPVCSHPFSDEAYEICPHCMWERDPYAEAEPDRGGGPNHMSLNEARAKHARGEAL